jgi:tetratricopeptide (TPR) repeat protein
MLETPEMDASKSIDRSLNRIQSYVASLRWTNAEREADELLSLAPERAEPHYWRGYLHHVFGERTEAERHYETAATLGSKEVLAKLELIRLEAIVSSEQPTELPKSESGEQKMQESNAAVSAINPANRQTSTDTSHSEASIHTIATHTRLATLLDEHGWSGRSVAVLEAARARFGDQAEILVPLAELYRKFARPEDAATLYRLALKEQPHEKAIRQGLNAAEAALREPKF